MKIRASNPEDIPAIARVRVDTWKVSYRGLVPDEVLDSLSYETTEKRWRQILWEENRGGHAFVAEDEQGRVVGFAISGPVLDGQEAEYKGGGNGFNSIYFAQQGHSVTLLDYSPVMLADAKQAAEKEGVLEKITFCQADARAIRDFLPGQQFDLILCHLMIEFVPETRVVLKNICELLAPEGLLSLVDSNRYVEVYRKAFQANDLVAALNVVDTKEYFHPWFSRLTPLFSSIVVSKYRGESRSGENLEENIDLAGYRGKTY